MAFAILNLLDILTTLYAGFALEANPVVVSLGVEGWLLSKVLLVGYFLTTAKLFDVLGCAVLNRYYKAMMTGIYATVVLWNIRYLILR